jgi:hypothetical protein
MRYLYKIKTQLYITVSLQTETSEHLSPCPLTGSVNVYNYTVCVLQLISTLSGYCQVTYLHIHLFTFTAVSPYICLCIIWEQLYSIYYCLIILHKLYTNFIEHFYCSFFCFLYRLNLSGSLVSYTPIIEILNR